MIYTANPLMWRIEAFGTLTEGPSHRGNALHCCLCAPFHLGSYLLSCGWLKVKGWHSTRKSVEPLRPPRVSWSICRKPTNSPLLWVQALTAAVSAPPQLWAQKWGFSFCSQFLPMAAFLPLVYFPVPKWLLSFAPPSGGLCHFKQNNLSPQFWQMWVIPQRHSITLAIWIMVGKVIVGSCVKHLEADLITPRNLKLEILGLEYKMIDISISRSSYSIIPDSSCLSSYEDCKA